MLKRSQVFLSTIDPLAGDLARQHGLGLEIAEYCTAWNLDSNYPQTDAAVRQECRDVSRRLFHGPFNELYPCAVDPLARELAARRFGQALSAAREYGASKLILHGGFDSHLYFPCWYVEQSALFWREFLNSHPGDYEICLENVLEPEPGMLLDIITRTGDPRLRLCLDIGHVNAYARSPVQQWLDSWGEHLSHAHIHNNDGTADTHSGPEAGTMDLCAILPQLQQATLTLEMPVIGQSLAWLTEHGLLQTQKEETE